MKKLGFTLAEVMIALSLIGVIASLTIPTFVSETKNKANANKLATTVSAIENAFTSMIANEGVQDLSETAFAGSPTAGNLSNYLKISGSSGNYVNLYNNNNKPFKDLSGSSNTLSWTDSFKMKNGAYIIYSSNSVDIDSANVTSWGGTITNSIGRIIIDVNGSLKPNIWGRDAFYFRIGNDGLLYPAGSLNFSILEKNSNSHLWNGSSGNFLCNEKEKTQGCTARLIENNYEVDY